MQTANPKWDKLFTNALVFDGTRKAPRNVDVAVSGNRVAAIDTDLPPEQADEVIDCRGLWLMPGLLDIHTHFDLEVEISPKLEEAVRHGTTTAVVSNCSLGVCFGSQLDEATGQNPIVDCFARVENVPKPVLQQVVNQIDWNDSGDYLKHFDSMNLGPNLVPMIPHSMLRIEAMGLQASVTREPTEEELQTMESLVEKGMQEGYVGFSTDDLPFHYLANDPNRQTRIPTQYAPFKELKRITDVLRRHDRVWQATPPKDSPPMTFRKFLLTSGRLYGKPLKVTATAAIDLRTNTSIVKLGRLLVTILNSWFVQGIFRLQALSTPFKVWSDGVVTPLAEEVPELRELNELDLEDREGRQKILNDPEYVKRFRKMWYRGKRGFNLARLKRVMKRDDNVLSRDLNDMEISLCPVGIWSGETMQVVYDRLLKYQSGDSSAARDDEERSAFDSFPKPIADDAEYVLHLLRSYDTGFRWCTITANMDEKVVRDLLFNPKMIPGFNDSGAHLTNLAFFDGNLVSLRIAKAEGLDQVAHMIHRLTAEPADFFGLDAGRLAVGERADIAVIDPANLDGWDWQSTVTYIYREEFQHHQLVNRPPNVVQHTMVNGEFAWRDGQAGAALGEKPLGRVMRHRDHQIEREHRVTPAEQSVAQAA